MYAPSICTTISRPAIYSRFSDDRFHACTEDAKFTWVRALDFTRNQSFGKCSTIWACGATTPMRHTRYCPSCRLSPTQLQALWWWCWPMAMVGVRPCFTIIGNIIRRTISFHNIPRLHVSKGHRSGGDSRCHAGCSLVLALWVATQVPISDKRTLSH